MKPASDPMLDFELADTISDRSYKGRDYSGVPSTGVSKSIVHTVYKKEVIYRSIILKVKNNL